MTTFLIVDDHHAFRKQARALLESEGLAVVGEAADGQSALDAVQAMQPDVVVLDIGLPDIDGFVVAERIAGSARPPDVVLISSREATTYGSRLEASPAVGFVQKDDLSAAALVQLLAGRFDWGRP
jgi:DNA-binding NarL/FixJ family response regulator